MLSAGLKIFAGLAIVALGIFLGPLIGLLYGAFIGWVAGLFFPGTLDIVATTLTGHVLPHWQLGAALGFTGGFLRNKAGGSSNKKEKEPAKTR